MRNSKERTCQELANQQGLEIAPGYLRFPVVKKMHSGVYICKAENNMGREEAVTKLTVYGLYHID